MADMAKTPPQYRQYVRTTPELKQLSEGVLGKVRRSKPYASRRKKLTYEAFVNASWMWMNSLDAQELADRLGPYIAEFERMWPIWSKAEDDPVNGEEGKPTAPARATISGEYHGPKPKAPKRSRRA